MDSNAKLNKGQEAAAEGFFNFLFSDKSAMIISGPGGVGKTFLMGHLIDQITPRYHEACQLMGIKPLYSGVMMTATTNKAAEVLGRATRRPTQTIHSFLRLRIEDNFETGVSRLTKNKNWQVHQNLILFVDECSMIDFSLRQYIREGTHRCKIIFVGDHCQLAPVTEKISPIYRENLPFYELTEPMRNAGQPALLEVCNQLRETVETGVFKPIRAVPGVVDLLGPEAMEAEVRAHFMDPTNQDRILAYTNARVIEYNDYIRHIRGLPPALTVGDRVVSNSAFQSGSQSQPGSSMAVEDEFLVTKVGGAEQVEIEPEVMLDVVICSLQGVHKSFTNLPVPTDREHFAKLVKYYAKKKDWVRYYKLKNNFPDLRPRDAATVHKSQGSTYDTVFIDLNDLSTCRDANVAARLLYVAFTRAKNRVVLYGKLAPKYGGVVS